MYAYQNSTFVYDGQQQWRAEPDRPGWQLWLRFVLTVLGLPVWWLLLLAFALVMIVVAMFAEILTVIPGFERGAERAMDSVIGKISLWPRWAVTWPELNHEGDTAFHAARVDAYLDKWTKRAARPKAPKKPAPPTECEVPWRTYRGVGGAYVVEAAARRGWELRPSDPAQEIRLWWSAASAAGATGPGVAGPGAGGPGAPGPGAFGPATGYPPAGTA
ncbi:hypothetical protein SMD44_01959 [Streptomyces alboflavus]|uniref:Uncharacterized protein n=1 Tax=Streptomyces alboflavus TaxID=67267 RepID=A0A1Z1W820_9ACTN|nr:hypothetical protein [Streptomyces alboflavus]ARX82546.1 hypothetical protein SMD44_01959 [Streptomyces alboflavus]